MRPRIRADARYTTTDEGAVWLTPSGIATMRGNGIGRWLDTLIPSLNGRIDLDELLSRIPQPRQRVVREIIDRLTHLGVLEDCAGPHETSGPPPIASVLLAGSESLVEAAMATAVGAGLHGIHPLPYNVPTFPEAVATADLTVHLCLPTDAHRLDHLCATHSARLLHAVLLDGVGCVGPVPPTPGTPWAAIAGRLAHDRLAAPREIDSAMRDLVVAQALHHARAWSTATPASGSTPSVVLVTADSQVTRHPFTPAPGATADAPATSSPPAYTVARPFGERVVRLVDPRLGIISEIREVGHRQAPIHVSEAEVRRPGHPTGTPIRLVAAGETLSEARATVARKALEWYAAHCFDERLTDGPDAARAPGIRVVTGRRLSDDNPVPLRVNEVFELTPTPSPAVPAGVGSGESWSDAVLAGLLSRVCQLATAAVGHEPVPPLALRAMTANSDIRITLTELTAAGLQADLCDLTSHSGIPTVGVVADGSLAAVASDVSLVGAVRAAVRAAVLRQQSALDTAIPAATSGVVLPVRLGAAPVRPSADVSLSEAVHALEAKGLIPVAADLDHDPAISDALPYVVRVVLHG